MRILMGAMAVLAAFLAAGDFILVAKTESLPVKTRLAAQQMDDVQERVCQAGRLQTSSRSFYASKERAQSKAVQRWEKAVAKRYGVAFANWHMADQSTRSIYCRQPAGTRYYCIADARPCRPSIGSQAS